MNEKLKYAVYGSLIAISVVGVAIAFAWKPFIQPQLNASAKQAGSNALSGFLSSIGIG